MGGAWSEHVSVSGVSASKRIKDSDMRKICLHLSGIVVLEDHLMMDLQLDKMRTSVAGQLQVQEHTPES